MHEEKLTNTKPNKKSQNSGSPTNISILLHTVKHPVPDIEFMSALPSIHVQFFYSVFQTCTRLPLTSTEAHACTHLPSLLPVAVEY